MYLNRYNFKESQNLSGLSVLWMDDFVTTHLCPLHDNHRLLLYGYEWFHKVRELLIKFPERESLPKVRAFTLIFACLGCYPQYRAICTLLLGTGWLEGDWKSEHKKNNQNLYIIEPLIESMLQVIQLCIYRVSQNWLSLVQVFAQTIIFYIVKGPGESNGIG